MPGELAENIPRKEHEMTVKVKQLTLGKMEDLYICVHEVFSQFNV